MIQEGELVVGISMSVAENYDKHEDPVYVNFLLAAGENIQRVLHVPGGGQIPIVVRSVKQQMPLHEFMGLFKRFEVTLSPSGDFEGKVFASPNF